MGEWISVEDRLPTECEEVLLVYEYNGNRRMVIDALYKNYFRSTIVRGFEPICWMPLPEPPK